MIKYLTLQSWEELADYVHDLASEDLHITVALTYEETELFMRLLLDYDDISVGCLEYSDGSLNAYDREYLITLTAELELYVEPAYKVFDNKGKYLTHNENVLILSGDVNSKIAFNTECTEKYELVIENGDECGDCYDDCFQCKNCSVGDKWDVIEYIINHLN